MESTREFSSPIPANPPGGGPRIASVSLVPVDTLGGMQVFARWLNEALTGGGYDVTPVSTPLSPWMEPPSVWASIGELTQTARVSLAARRAGPFEGYVVHAPSAFVPGPGLTIFHLNLLDYAEMTYSKWHPNHWKLHWVNMGIEARMGAARRLNIAVSHGQAAGLRRRGIRVDEVVHSPVDFTRFTNGLDRAEARARLGWPQDAFIALTPGRVARGKGWERLIRLAAERPLAKFFALGPRPEDFPHSPANFKAFGPAPHHELPDYYRAADLTILLSSAESCPYVLCESLACGTAIMATPTGLGCDLRDLGGALTHAVTNMAEPARDLKIFDHLAESPLLRDEIGLAGREFILKHADAWVNAERYRELMKRALGA